MKDNYFLWLGGVFDEKTALEAPAVSLASNRWQRGLLNAIKKEGEKLQIVGHLPEPVWPRGRTRVKTDSIGNPDDLSLEFVNYLNLPYIRRFDLAYRYIAVIDEIIRQRGIPRAVFSYDIKLHTGLSGLYAQSRYRCPWVPVVADFPPSGPAAMIHEGMLSRAYGRVFLPWGSYEESPHRPKLHLDGGVDQVDIPSIDGHSKYESVDYMLYAGGMHTHKGVDFLLDAFEKMESQDCELWFCGSGRNERVERKARQSPRIRSFGLVTDEELDELLRGAAILLNPRSPSHELNTANFPSKILLYLSYGKPIVSTWTDGLAPEYREVLEVVEGGRAESLAATIEDVFSWGDERRTHLRERICKFLKNRTWSHQARRLLNWFGREIETECGNASNQVGDECPEGGGG